MPDAPANSPRARPATCAGKKKIKCDGKLPSCTHCCNYKTECVFTQVEKKRKPAKRVSPPSCPSPARPGLGCAGAIGQLAYSLQSQVHRGLENRLVRMESLLRLSGKTDGALWRFSPPAVTDADGRAGPPAFMQAC